jgi:hypothetical protein
MNKESVGASEFDLSNSQYPYAKPEIRYGNHHVPRPSNEAAKRVDHAKVMRQVREAR